MTGTDLVYSSASLNDRKQYAQALAAAGSLLPPGLMENGHPSPGKILLVAETGNMLGIHPVAAITGINIIQGKPSVAPALMSALVRERGHKLRVKVRGTVGTGDLAVTVTLIRKDDPEAPFEVKWTIEDAIDAGLVKAYTLDPKTNKWAINATGSWKTYPRQMLLHRATAEVCRQGANEVVMGVYTPEELGAQVNSEGELVDVTATAVDRTPGRYEQDHDGPAVVTAMQTEPERIDPHSTADEYAEKAAKALTVTDARTLYREASHKGILGYTLTTGELLEDVLRARGEHLAEEEAQAAQGEPEEAPLYDESELA